MLLHMYKVPETLFIVVTIITVMYALAKTNLGKAGKNMMLAGIGLGLALAVLRAVTHEFPAFFFPDRKAVPDTQINLYLWYAAMVMLVPLHITVSVFSRERGSRAGKAAVCVLSALLSADLALAGMHCGIPTDEVLGAMKAVGRSLPVSLRETALGGLAATETAKRIAKEL